MTPREPVTVAEETITLAMMSAAICCVLASYLIVQNFGLAGPDTFVLFAVLVVASLVVSAYMVPHLTAQWVGSPLEEIMK